MKTFGSTFLLLLIVAVVGSYIYFNERGPIAATGATVLLRLEPNTISSLRLSQPGQVVVLRKSGTTWSAQQGGSAKGNPPAVPADGDMVQALVDQLQLVQSTSVVPGGVDKLTAYGLSKPQSTLVVGGATIDFGSKPSFDAGKIYARVGAGKSSQIALLPASLNAAVTKSFNEWRDKVLLHVALGDVTQCAVTAPAISATFVPQPTKNSDTAATWQITTPLSATADTTTVESFINQFPHTKTTKFLADNPPSPAAWGLDKPTATVRLTTKDGVRSLLVGKKLKDGYAAQNSSSPAVFQLAPATFGLINRVLRDWRSKSVVRLDNTDLTQLEITARGTTRRCTRSGDKWQAVGAAADASSHFISGVSASDMTHQAVIDTIIALQSLSAQDFIDKPVALSTYGLDKPTAEFHITTTQAATLLRVQLGTAHGKVYARSGTEGAFAPTVYVLPANTLDSFKGPFDSLLGK